MQNQLHQAYFWQPYLSHIANTERGKDEGCRQDWQRHFCTLFTTLCTSPHSLLWHRLLSLLSLYGSRRTTVLKEGWPSWQRGEREKKRKPFKSSLFHRRAFRKKLGYKSRRPPKAAFQFEQWAAFELRPTNDDWRKQQTCN